MAEVTIYINGRNYNITCDNGQEGRVVDLASYIDQRLQQISRSGAAYNDAHLMVLTALVLADELFDIKEQAGAVASRTGKSAAVSASPVSKEDDVAMLRLLEQITKRIDGIAARVQSA
jgi:cell division protein ZapA